MTMEGLFEFVIYSFLNFYSVDLTLNGEVLGVLISSFCIFLASIFLTISLLWAIFSKDDNKLLQMNSKKVGELFLNSSRQKTR